MEGTSSLSGVPTSGGAGNKRDRPSTSSYVVIKARQVGGEITAIEETNQDKGANGKTDHFEHAYQGDGHGEARPFRKVKGLKQNARVSVQEGQDKLILFRFCNVCFTALGNDRKLVNFLGVYFSLSQIR